MSSLMRVRCRLVREIYDFAVYTEFFAGSSYKLQFGKFCHGWNGREKRCYVHRRIDDATGSARSELERFVKVTGYLCEGSTLLLFQRQGWFHGSKRKAGMRHSENT